MAELFIIADDFTGALDTGVQFAARGIPTRVVTDPAYDLSQMDPSVVVMVMDAETRHLPAAEAHDIVYRAVKQACELGVRHIFKKTDSALRGNIGAELAAVLEASGEKLLPFLPALPGMNRCTVNGVHYIDGKPVAESVFGVDPFEPVRESDVTKLIALQTEITACKQQPGTVPACDGIAVYDASTAEDLLKSAEALKNAGKLRLMAGCAGFGAVVPELLGLDKGGKAVRPAMSTNLLMLCGSVNKITVDQMAWAEQNGFAHIHVPPEEKLVEGFFDTEEGKKRIAEYKQALASNPHVIIDTNDKGGNGPTNAYAAEHGLTIDDLRVGISATIGQIMGALFDDPNVGTLLVTGGDTLLQCMKRLGIGEMEPVCEIYSGVVLNRFSMNGVSRFVISKSGGFGAETLLTDMIAAFAE